MTDVSEMQSHPPDIAKYMEEWEKAVQAQVDSGYAVRLPDGVAIVAGSQDPK